MISLSLTSQTGSKNSNQYDLLRRIYKINGQMSWLHKIQGIDVSRCFEYTTAYQKIAKGTTGRVLDIGAYRSPFPVFLTHKGYEVSIVDMDMTIRRQHEWAQQALGTTAQLSASIADALHLPFHDQAFDAVTCISTIEHIPSGGDRQAAREIGRTLKRGGHCFISVPYSSVTRRGTWGRWFQRWFDLPTAMARLVQPSALSLVEYGFLIGGRIGRIADLWYALPRPMRHLMSWSHISLFPRAFEIDRADQNDARVLWLLLRK